MFTFDSWWAMWKPHWGQRGQKADSMQMCREGDTGPYSPDNCRIDTCINNRREASLTTRQRNNSSGVTGVSWNSARQRWVAFIHDDGRYKQLGVRGSLLDAAAIRISAENRMYRAALQEGKQ